MSTQLRSGQLRSAAQLAFVTVAYVVVAKFSLLLAIKPGYVTAVWPSAGIALAALLLGGRRMIIAIWIGAVVANSGKPDLAVASSVLQALAIAAILGTGATLQAVIAAQLVRRFIGWPNPLTVDRDIARFFCLGGLLACLFAPTVGIITLRFFGTLAPTETAFAWFTWWVGDIIGVMIFTPLILMSVASPKQVWRPRLFSVGLPMGLTLLVAVVVFVSARRWEDRQSAAALDRRTEGLAQAFQVGLNNTTNAVRALGGLFESSDEVAGHEFESFASMLLKQYPGIRGLTWNLIVPDDQRAQLEQAFQKEGIPDPTIKALVPGNLLTLSPHKPVYTVVRFVEPQAMYRRVIGMDSSSRPACLEAQQRANETGEMAMTGPVQIGPSRADGMSVLMFLPVFAHGPNEARATGHRRVVGYATAILRLDEAVIAMAAREDREGMRLELTDDSAPVSKRMLFSEPIDRALGDRYDQHVDRAFQVGGRHWRLRVYFSERYIAANQSLQSWAVLAGGVLFSGLLGFFLMILAGRAARVESLVTARTRELSVANEQLAAATRVKGEFLANMSHEIRTPMTAILGFTDLLARDKFTQPQERAEAMKTVRRNGEHVLTIINDVLDLSKIEAGRLDLERIPIDPGELLDDVLRTFQTVTRTKGIGLSIRLITGQLPVILGDPVRFRQVAINLVSNAIKFTETGGVEVATEWDAQRRDLRVHVRDSGVGMSPEQIKRLFTAFSQADVATTRRYGGTGLGLRISKRLAEMMQGDLTLTSEEGKGTTFTFSLPNRELAENHSHVSIDSDPLPAGSFPLKGLRVLVVDDGADNRLLLTLLLRYAGAEVEAFENPCDAIERLGRQAEAPIDLILMDMRMPQLDGPETTRRLRAMGARQPIIAVSANVMESDRACCIEAGCDDFLSKPVNWADLVQKCLEQLSKAQYGSSARK